MTRSEVAYNLRTFNEVDSHSWNESVVALNGCGFHSHEWSLFSSESNNAQPLYLQLQDATGRTCSAGFGLVSEKRTGGIGLYRELSLGSLPASASSAVLERMLREIVAYGRREGVAVLSINSFATPHGSEVLPSLEFKTERRWEFVLNMDGDEQDLWKKFHSKKRNLIKKAQKEGLHVERVAGQEGVMQLRELSRETHERKRSKGISYPKPGPERYYRLIKEKIIDKGLGRLYLAYNGQYPVAGSLFVGFNKKSYYMLSSASDVGLRKAAPDLILWTSMTDYLSEGYKIFNLGGLSERELEGKPLEESGLYHFKMRFSADRCPCFKGKRYPGRARESG